MRLKILPIFLILSLLLIGAFSFLGFNSIDHTGQHNCPISLMSGGGCLSVGGSMALVFHHISGIQNLTQSIINSDISLLILLILLTFALLVISKPLQETLATQLLSHQTRYRTTKSIFLPKKNFFRWLSFNYKQYPHVPQWAYDLT